TTGAIAFDRARSVAAAGSDDVPAQPLPWPSPVRPAAGFDTEVLVDVGDPATAETLYRGFAEQVADLLLELPSVERVDYDG
ncbi:hypothetical protein, partial [Klebsiella variicola]|uniref:hypothetical protein n=1 Tax=Klebsiella variicola TaxID=244366 RepID=UPI00272FE46E